MDIEKYFEIRNGLPDSVQLIAVSKFKPAEDIQTLYNEGQRAFGENKAQEMKAKHEILPKDIEWHFIGHLQTNKIKLVLPYASLVESVDSIHLLESIENWGSLNDRTVNVLLEFHLGAEVTKGGFHESEIVDVLGNACKGCYPHVRFCGLMGMATNTDDESVIEADFKRIEDFKHRLDDIFPALKDFKELSIGMSDDWPVAVRHGATIVRIGTAIFGPRIY